MRNKKEVSVEIRQPLMRRTPGDVSESVSVRDVINLRPCAGVYGGQLRPVGTVKSIDELGRYSPLCHVTTEAGAQVLCARGRRLATARIDSDEADVTPLGEILESDALCGVQEGDARALVMTEKGPVRVELKEGVVSTRLLDNDFPAVSLTAEDMGPLSVTVPSRILSRSYDGAQRLERRDAEDISSDLTAAYLTLCSRASAAGLALQPAIARYRLRDSAGRLLFTSAPVVLSHTSGAQLASTLPLYSTDRQTISAYTATAQVWRLKALFHKARGRAAEVASCEVYMTPLFHPYLPGTPQELSTLRAQTSQQPFIMASLPGYEVGLGTTVPGLVRRTLLRALSRLDELEELVGVIASPFATTTRTETLDMTPSADAGSVSRAVQKILSRPATQVSKTAALLSMPHTFTAGLVAADASVTAWSDIRVHRFGGYSAANLATSTGTAAWSAETKVRLGDGSCVTHSESYDTGVPLTLTPLLCYPSQDAREMSVTISSGGVTRHFTAALNPDSSGRYGAYAADRPTPIEPVAGAGTTSGTAAQPISLAGVVAFSPSDNATSIDTFTHSGMDIRAIVARPGAEQSWEFGRCRFVAGGTGGIYSIGVGKDRKALSVRRLGSQAVADCGCICRGEGTELFILARSCAGISTAIYRLTSNGRIELFAEGNGYAAIGYDMDSGELSAYLADGGADVFCRDAGWRHYHRTDVCPESVHHIGHEVYGRSEAGLLRLLHEDASGADVRLEVLLRTKGGASMPTYLTAGLTAASGIDGTLTVEGCDAGGARRWPVFSGRFVGALRSPYCTALRSRAVQGLAVTLAAHVEADMVFDNLTIDFLRV